MGFADLVSCRRRFFFAVFDICYVKNTYFFKEIRTAGGSAATGAPGFYVSHDFTYSHKFTNQNTVLIFLKGKMVKNEIEEAKKNWSFSSEIYPSYSDKRGNVLVIKNLKFKK